MADPLVDLTTIHGVESLFRGGARDPWGPSLAGALADLYIYSSSIRYALPLHDSADTPPESLKAPSLLRELWVDQNDFRPEAYSTAEPRLLEDKYLVTSFEAFAAWATLNQPDLCRILSVHRESWVRDWHLAHVHRELVFSLEALRRTGRLRELATRLGIQEQDIAYEFDAVLRYPLYGELAGDGVLYLNHPIRKAIPFPTLQVTPQPGGYGPISWASDIARSAGRMSQGQYVTLLRELREHMQEGGYDRLRPGQFNPEVAREIAIKVRLRPRIRQLNETVGVFADAASTGHLAFAFLRPVVAVLESISNRVWGGRALDHAARVSWLRPIIKWDFEDQAERRQ